MWVDGRGSVTAFWEAGCGRARHPTTVGSRRRSAWSCVGRWRPAFPTAAPTPAPTLVDHAASSQVIATWQARKSPMTKKEAYKEITEALGPVPQWMEQLPEG